MHLITTRPLGRGMAGRAGIRPNKADSPESIEGRDVREFSRGLPQGSFELCACRSYKQIWSFRVSNLSASKNMPSELWTKYAGPWSRKEPLSFNSRALERQLEDQAKRVFSKEDTHIVVTDISRCT
jgi:hypothetical protein